MSESPRPALGELARLATADIAELNSAAQEYEDSADACDTPALAGFRRRRYVRAKALRAAAERIAQLVALATGGAEDTARRNQRIVDLVCADGSLVQRSKINAGMVVVIDGRDGLDACQRSASDCFDALFEEQDGGTPPPRLYISVGLTPERPADAGQQNDQQGG